MISNYNQAYFVFQTFTFFKLSSMPILRKYNSSEQGNRNHMGYRLSYLFPVFLTFMGSFWHKNECLPIPLKYLSYCCMLLS